MPDILASLPGLAWALPLAGIAKLASRSPDVAKAPVVDDIPVSIIIPARNESETIETVVTSILASTYGNFELIVVDDRSTDDTAAKLRSLAVHDARVRVVDGAELPAGWFGKPWACHQGAEVATGRYLLFTDADTTHAPALLGHAIGAIEASGADLLTLTSQQDCVTFWERIVMPQIWVLLGLRYPPHRVNVATRPDQLVANGQFILVRRESYAAIGGHEAVRGDVVEDLALAQRMLRTGHRVRLEFGETLLSTRMYRSLGEMVEGWSKNLYVGAKQSAGDNAAFRMLAPSMLLLGFAFWMLPPILLALGIAAPAMQAAIGCSLFFWALVSFGMRIPPWHAVFYPLGALVAGLIASRSIWRGARRIEWRGRSYSTS